MDPDDQARITGYQIQFATSKTFTKNKKSVTVKGYKKAYRNVKKLKGGEKYYIRIRTYKLVSGKKYYSDWSKVRTVKIKKLIPEDNSSNDSDCPE